MRRITELTPEQDKYLEQREPALLSKAKTILYNLQNFLNILLAEYYGNDGGTENSTQRKLLKNNDGTHSTDNGKTKDKFTTDAIK